MTTLSDFTQPEENVRSIVVGKNTLFLKRTDPYGFVSMNFERGELPEMLKGQFTSFDEAAKRVNTYLSNRPPEAAPFVPLPEDHFKKAPSPEPVVTKNVNYTTTVSKSNDSA